MFCERLLSKGRQSAQILFCFNLLAVLLASQGCSSIAKRVEDEQVANIEIGKSTRDDVLNILGLPNRTERRVFEADKLELWIYYKGRGKRTFGIVVPVPIVGTAWWDVFSRNITVDERNKMATVVAFNETGTVVDVKENADVAR